MDNRTVIGQRRFSFRGELGDTAAAVHTDFTRRGQRLFIAIDCIHAHVVAHLVSTSTSGHSLCRAPLPAIAIFLSLVDSGNCSICLQLGSIIAIRCGSAGTVQYGPARVLYSETDLGCMEKNEQVMVEVDRWFGFLDENWWEESQRWSRVSGRINHARSLVLKFFT